jgi:hypothetical protein
MARQLTLKCERRVEDAADAIRDWANDVIDGLYDPGPCWARAWWADKLPELVAEFTEAAEACEAAPKSGPGAERQGAGGEGRRVAVLEEALVSERAQVIMATREFWHNATVVAEARAELIEEGLLAGADEGEGC